MEISNSLKKGLLLSVACVALLVGVYSAWQFVKGAGDALTSPSEAAATVVETRDGVTTTVQTSQSDAMVIAKRLIKADDALKAMQADLKTQKDERDTAVLALQKAERNHQVVSRAFNHERLRLTAELAEAQQLVEAVTNALQPPVVVLPAAELEAVDVELPAIRPLVGPNGQPLE